MRQLAIKKYIRWLLFLVCSVLAMIYSQSLLWMPLMMLSAFFCFVDVFNADANSQVPHNVLTASDELGVLGSYIVDSTESYGLFMTINGKAVFVDIREDSLIKEREKQALSLFQNVEKIEKSFNDFLSSNSAYQSKELVYIGLHSSKLDEGEVFWEPDGYTKLKDMQFVVE